jgi:hypothetical protein
MINTIKTQIKNTLSAHCAGIQEIRTYNAIEFNGFPAVSVTTSDNVNDYETNTENMRTFAFKIRCFVPISNAGQPVTEEKYERAERVMGDLVWSVINTLDNHYTLDGSVEYLDAAPSVWEYVEMQNGFTLMANILLKVHKSYTLT